MVFAGDVDFVCNLRVDRPEQSVGRPESVRLTCFVQSSTFPHVHVPNACRCLRPGKKKKPSIVILNLFFDLDLI